MKKPVYILMIAAALGVGAGVSLWPKPAPPPVSEQPAPQAAIEEPEAPEPMAAVCTLVAPPPEPSPETNQVASAVEVPQAENPVTPKPTPREQATNERYWQQVAKIYEQRRQRFNREQNPARRAQLIKQIARYVRYDTPAALEWAMGLEDPEEKRLALEAINKNALVGIGAHIEMDETGVPKIKQTTIMSAVESSGMVEPGDHIAGVVKADGSTVYFQGQSMQQIVNQLRGEPGTEIQLLMERPMIGNAAYAFAIPVQRSLIVVQPPY